MHRFRISTLRVFFFLLLFGVMAAISLRWFSLERWRWNLEHTEISPERIVERTPPPAPTPPRPPVIGGKLETARLFSGITVNATVEPTPGGAASDERADPQSYVLDLKLHTRMPAPNRTIEDLAKVSPELPRVLPGLAELIANGSVSPFFAELYDTKLKRLRANLTRLDQLLSRHNFYDCQTVLQLKHPQSQRKAVLMQAEMDVDADGSDADRLPAGSGTSSNFQPFTSYRWPKKGSNANVYSGVLEERITSYQAEADQKGTSAARKTELKGMIAQARDGLDQLKKFSFLIGATDPYIVIPGGFAKTEGAKVGDLALVIYGESIFPALVGDVGPSDKTGEASLRIAKEISASANPMNRPVSDLRVSYIIFPGTAETPFGPPDLEKLQARCEALVNEIGGASVPLHKWVSILPTPTPTPTPTPIPPPTPSPGTSPSPTGSPGASPAPTFAFPLSSPSVTPSPSPSPTASPSPSATTKPSTKPRRKPSPTP